MRALKCAVIPLIIGSTFSGVLRRALPIKNSSIPHAASLFSVESMVHQTLAYEPAILM